MEGSVLDIVSEGHDAVHRRKLFHQWNFEVDMLFDPEICPTKLADSFPTWVNFLFLS